MEDMEEDYEEEGEEEMDYGYDEEEPDPTKYKLVKRVPQRAAARENDIYVTRSTKLVAQMKRAKKILLSANISEINIHGLGAALYRAVELAQALVEDSNGTLRCSPTTSTVQLIDDYEPLTDDLPPITRVRYNSAIHIKISKVPKKKKK